MRLISQEVGYTERRSKTIRVPTLAEMRQELASLDLDPDYVADESGVATAFGLLLHDYFEHRAALLNDRVQHDLMDADEASALYAEVRAMYTESAAPQPMNKQKGEKKAAAYFTGIVNTLIEAHAGDHAVDYDPRGLTSITRDRAPYRTLARRVDGAFPARVNPIAIWEIKEYYYTTTFGSRVADGVYETLLDGLELAESADALSVVDADSTPVLHYLFVDSRYTWWECGRSYLCRIVDMLHMGLVTEVCFGREVVERLPEIVPDWVSILEQRVAGRVVVSHRPGQVPTSLPSAADA